MIGRLQGTLIEKKPPLLLIDVNGVGYEVNASMQTFYQLPQEGQTATLHIHMVVREDAQQLFGFLEKRERALFRSLIKVNGVGPKLALTILSGVEPTAFVHCVLNGDAASLVKLPGVGKKTAERLIIEMRDRLSDWHEGEGSIDSASGAALLSNTQAVTLDSLGTPAKQDAVSALIALGYKPQEATRLVSKVYEEDLSSEVLIRLALKEAA